MEADVDNGGMLVSLAPNTAYRAQELINERRSKDRQDEYLVRWTLQVPPRDNKGSFKPASGEANSMMEPAKMDYCMWMRREEIEACCPHLLSYKSTSDVPASATTKTCGGLFDPEDATDSATPLETDEAMSEMKSDVKNLITRAKKLLDQESNSGATTASGNNPTTGTAGSRVLASTVNILNAYAKIGLLSESFQEYGAVDLLLGLITFRDVDVRRNASAMLRSLTAHDRSVRGYVLLRLINSDEGSKSTLQSRQMLLDLFSETATADESDVRGVGFPQVSGRYIFSILQKYLRVTSNIIPDLPPASSSGPPESGGQGEEGGCRGEDEEFVHFHLWSQLLGELFSIFGWYEGALDPELQQGMGRIRKGESIFTGLTAKEAIMSMAKKRRKRKKQNPYKIRSDFRTDRDYARYVKATIEVGSRVRAIVNYENVHVGYRGTYVRTNNGSPPAQFEWEELGETYWVYWHMVEILAPYGGSDGEEEAPEVMESQQISAHPPPYTMHSLTQPGPGNSAAQSSLSLVPRTFWWEILSLVKSLPEDLTTEVVRVIEDEKLKTFNDLVHFSPTFPQAAAVVQHLVTAHPHLAFEPLSIKDLPRFRDVYKDVTSHVPPAEDSSKDANLNTSKYPVECPFADRFDTEDPLPSKFDRSSLSDEPDEYRYPVKHMLKGTGERNADLGEPTLRLRFLLNAQDGSLERLAEGEDAIYQYRVQYPTSVRVAVCALRLLQAAYERVNDHTVRQELCVSGHFGKILELMSVEPRSCALQVAGLEAFFHLMGGFGINTSLPLPPTVEKGEGRVTGAPFNREIRTVIVSLAASPDPSTDLRMLFRGLECIVNWYHTSLSDKLQRSCSIAIRHGLWIICFLCEDEDLVYQMHQWYVPEVVEIITNCYPDFPTKRELILKISEVLSDYIPSAILEQDITKLRKTLNYEISSAIKTLRHREDMLGGKNPLPRLLSLMGRDLTSTSIYHTPSKLFAEVFLNYHGIFYLGQALQHNRSSVFVENAFVLIASLIAVGEEEAAQVVLQGGIRTVLFARAINYRVKMVHRIALDICEMLAKDPDNVVVMSTENVIELMHSFTSSAYDHHEHKMANELIELLNSKETARSADNQKILSIIFTGTLQMLLNAIEESRREKTFVNMPPKLSTVVKHLSSGTGGTMSLGVKGKWCDYVEVSSSDHLRPFLFRKGPTCYWESCYRECAQHWIRLHLKKGLVIKKLFMEIRCSDGSLMPQRVQVRAGKQHSDFTDLSTVYIPPTFSGHFEILSDQEVFHPVITVFISRCQQGGQDTRVYSLTCQVQKSSLWPIFGDQYLYRSQLFYHVQVQTWLKDEGLGPLELFEKLSNVMLHEQNFAEYFLATLPARQCIGQACRNGVISPLIRALTQDSAAGMLGKLIEQYLDSVRPPPSQWTALVFPDTPTSDHMDLAVAVLAGERESSEYREERATLIKMSRLRCMCRILVDCDDKIVSSNTLDVEKALLGEESGEESDSSEEEEEEEGAVEVSESCSPAPPGSGTVSVAQCWREIVFSAISQVLLRYDQDPPLVLCAQLLAAYDKLRQAKLELFGGHSQFAIALKEGFTMAFQGLDEVRVMRVCERLTLCVDMVMDPLNKEAARFKSFGEHEREALLSQLAEPLQFLHCLDLAHVLEFYYRHHLSSRLLRGRSISLPLERRLAQTFAHVFPHKYPLQMLQDMEDSQRLMDRFCDSDYLERLDQVLAHVDPQAELPAEALEHSKKCSFYRKRCCQVHILNSSHWPIWHQYLPLSSLPPPLSSFTEDFAHFFALSHSYGLRQHECARKLHFTTYGWSTLSYGAASLNVSTVQMLILLQFNKNTAVSLSSLRKATQLSLQTLAEALLPLTTGGQNILTLAPHTNSSDDQGSEKPHPPPRGVVSGWGLDEREEVVRVQRFKKSTKFILNEEFLSDLGSRSVRFEGVQVSAGREREGLEQVLRRRRGIIDSAIVRILKREKEMSQESLATMITEGCAAGQFDHGASFGRFHCTYRDVVARVYYLKVEGYLYHNEHNQNYLVYIPDRDTEVQVQQETHSNSPYPHSETESSSTSDPYFPRPHELADVPNVGSLASCETLDVDQVLAERWATVDTLAELLQLDRDSAEHALGHWHWKQNAIIDYCLRNPLGIAALVYDVGLGPYGIAQPLPPASSDEFELDPVGETTCQICLHVRRNDDFHALWCGHACCAECWAEHIKSRLRLEDPDGITCFGHRCNAAPTRQFVVGLFGEEGKVTKLYTDALFRNYLKEHGWLNRCSNPKGCDQILRSGGITSNTCHKCQWTCCHSCSFQESHEPVNCRYLQRWCTDGGYYINMTIHSRTEHLVRMIAKKCPSCGIQIEKNEGCMHMKCQCGFHFCWRCLKSWSPTHTDFFSCRGEVSKEAKDGELFAMYNRTVSSHHRPRQFAERLCVLVRNISESVPIRTLSFLIDACQLLVECHKMLSYTYIEAHYNTNDHEEDGPPELEYVSFLTETLEGDTHALQAFLENTLLSQPAQNIARAVRNLTERQLMDGYRLVGKIASTKAKFLVGQHHHLKFGHLPRARLVEENYYWSDQSGSSDDES